MSTLDSTSTLAEVKAAYDDNASYAEDDSTTKAAGFATACRILLRRQPKVASLAGRGGHEIQVPVDQLKAELDAATSWLALKSDAGLIKHPSFEYFR